MPYTAPIYAPRGGALGRRHDGFTLIEMMVVLIIVGVIVSLGMVRLTTDDDAAQVRREAERLGALLRLARDEAIVRARSMGLRLAPDGYRFAVYDAGQWRDMEGDTVFRERRLPEHLRLAIHGVARGARAGRAEGSDKPPPQVILGPGGEATPFELSIAGLDGRGVQRIHGGAMGRITIEAGDDS
ncbi:MAG: type II secretion system minor pseudopilin GspH [Gammaproteobacteria bacterium]|nr:type II secretion system minor pseudopilin GspH [Gammaproteobacteria bacterium]